MSDDPDTAGHASDEGHTGMEEGYPEHESGGGDYDEQAVDGANQGDDNYYNHENNDDDVGEHEAGEDDDGGQGDQEWDNGDQDYHQPDEDGSGEQQQEYGQVGEEEQQQEEDVGTGEQPTAYGEDGGDDDTAAAGYDDGGGGGDDDDEPYAYHDGDADDGDVGDDAAHDAYDGDDQHVANGSGVRASPTIDPDAEEVASTHEHEDDDEHEHEHTDADADANADADADADHDGHAANESDPDDDEVEEVVAVEQDEHGEIHGLGDLGDDLALRTDGSPEPPMSSPADKDQGPHLRRRTSTSASANQMLSAPGGDALGADGSSKPAAMFEQGGDGAEEDPAEAAKRAVDTDGVKAFDTREAMFRLPLRVWVVPGTVIPLSLIFLVVTLYTIDVAAFKVNRFAEFGTMMFDPSLEQAKSSLDDLGKLMSTFTSVVLTISSIVLQLASNRFTPHITSLFFRDKVVMGIICYMVITNTYVVWINYMAGPSFEPKSTAFGGVVLVTGSLLSLFPYFTYLFDFLDPHKFVRQITAEGVSEIRGVTRGSGHPEEVREGKKRTVESIERLTDIASNALMQKDSNIATDVLDALQVFCVHYGNMKKDLNRAWYTLGDWIRQSPDYISLSAEAVRDIEDRKCWLEWKVLRRAQALFAESMRGNKDLCYVVAINTRRLGQAAAKRADFYVVDLAIKFFNTFLRASMNASDERTAYNVLHQYRQLGEAIVRLLRFNPFDNDGDTEQLKDRVGRIARFFRYYAIQCAETSNLMLMSDIMAYDLGEMCEAAFYLESECHEDVLHVFLTFNDLQDGTSLEASRAMRFAQIKLGTTYLTAGRADLALEVQEEMACEEPRELLSLWNELKNVDQREFWEVNDRGTNFNFLTRAQKQMLPVFFAAFEPLHEIAKGQIRNATDVAGIKVIPQRERGPTKMRGGGGAQSAADSALQQKQLLRMQQQQQEQAQELLEQRARQHKERQKGHDDRSGSEGSSMSSSERRRRKRRRRRKEKERERQQRRRDGGGGGGTSSDYSGSSTDDHNNNNHHHHHHHRYRDGDEALLPGESTSPYLSAAAGHHSMGGQGYPPHGQPYAGQMMHQQGGHLHPNQYAAQPHYTSQNSIHGSGRGGVPPPPPPLPPMPLVPGLYNAGTGGSQGHHHHPQMGPGGPYHSSAYPAGQQYGGSRKGSHSGRPSHHRPHSGRDDARSTHSRSGRSRRGRDQYSDGTASDGRRSPAMGARPSSAASTGRPLSSRPPSMLHIRSTTADDVSDNGHGGGGGVYGASSSSARGAPPVQIPSLLSSSSAGNGGNGNGGRPKPPPKPSQRQSKQYSPNAMLQHSSAGVVLGGKTATPRIRVSDDKVVDDDDPAPA